MQRKTATATASDIVRRGVVPALVFLLLAACGERDGATGDAPIDDTNPTPAVTPATPAVTPGASLPAEQRRLSVDDTNPAPAVTLPLDADSAPLTPPVAEERPHEVTAPHGATRQDEYYWLRDDERADPDMLAYLEAENGYADAVMAPLADSQAALYGELVGRIKQDDSSVPYKYKDYWYYTRFEEGQEYPIYARRRGNMDAPEEVMLDVNRLAEGHDFYQVGNWEVSPDQTLLAYVEDTVGRRQYTLRVKELGGDETLSVQIPGVSTSIAWAADNRTLFYVVNDAETLLTRWVKTHTLGGEPGGEAVGGPTGGGPTGGKAIGGEYVGGEAIGGEGVGGEGVGGEGVGGEGVGGEGVGGEGVGGEGVGGEGVGGEGVGGGAIGGEAVGDPVSGDAGSDPIVYEELDDSFYMGLSTTRSEKYICIVLESTVSSELRCTEAAAPGEFRVLAPRERDFEYSADHHDSRWVIRTNWNAENFKLMEVGDDVWGDRSEWRDLIGHDADVFIGGFELFDDFMAVGERSGGLTRVRIVEQDGQTRYVEADETAYTMALSVNAEPATDQLRYTYTSMTTPASTHELNVRTGERTLLKEQPVLGGFDKNDYVTERLWATARDGARIPVSVLYRNGFERDGTAALLQYGYGSYGYSNDPRFSSNVLSLVDRGMVYALAHVRGGQEMGRSWYDDGKLLNKVNTFTDFIDVTDFLVDRGYAAPDRVAAMGGSAGGLLVGAVVNMAPEKYRAIVSLVPFVDVVTTMLDASIPLTTNEYDEWGNPEDEAYYDYILAYSPYDRLEAKDYPAMFVSTGLWDSQVQYWEPSKYVARLRARKTDDNLLVYRVQMEAGHGGQSGRFRRYRETAEQFAFLLNQLGVETLSASE